MYQHKVMSLVLAVFSQPRFLRWGTQASARPGARHQFILASSTIPRIGKQSITSSPFSSMIICWAPPIYTSISAITYIDIWIRCRLIYWLICPRVWGYAPYYRSMLSHERGPRCWEIPSVGKTRRWSASGNAPLASILARTSESNFEVLWIY